MEPPLEKLTTVEQISLASLEQALSELRFRPFFLSNHKFLSQDNYEFISLIPTKKGKLYLGAAYQSTEKWLNELQEKKIESVYSLGFSQWPPFSPCSPHPFIKEVSKTLVLLEDKHDAVASPNFKENFLDLISKLDRDLSAGKTVFIHCHAGISRSATAVIFYLMVFEQKSFIEAFDHVRRHRPIICPNAGFTTFLQRFDFESRSSFWKEIWSSVHELIVPQSIAKKHLRVGRVFWGPEKLPAGQLFTFPVEIDHYWDYEILPKIENRTSICLPPIIEVSLFRMTLIRELKHFQSLLFSGHNFYLSSVDGCGSHLLFLASLMFIWEVSEIEIQAYFSKCLPRVELDFLQLIPLLITLSK